MDKKMPEPVSIMFADDGSVPNNPKLPFLIYREAIDLKGTADPEKLIEQIFTENGWGNMMWRNGIFEYVHYHSMIHEAMGLARGSAKVRFGGLKGKELELRAGDVAILPAGTGHQCLWASRDLAVVGAYPSEGRYDLCRGGKRDHTNALTTIPDVPMPAKDPVGGKQGPLLTLWRA